MTTWNSADKDAAVTLSGGDLVASVTASSGGVRSTTSKNSGKNSFSVSGNINNTGLYAGVSLAGASRTLADANAIGVLYATGLGWLTVTNGSGQDIDGSSPAATGSDTVVVHVDSGANVVYFTANGNNLFGGDPAAGTGGISIPSGSIFGLVGVSASTASGTADFTPGSLPSGYSDWDGGGSPFSVAANGGTYSVTGTAVTLRQKPDWTLVGVSEAAVNASGNYTLTEPASCQQDDVLVVDFAVRSTVIYTNSDWTFPQSDSGGNTTNNTTASDTSFQTGYCIRGSSAPTLVFSRAAGSRALGTIRAYRSSTAGTPSFDTSAKVAMAVAGTTVTLTGGITTAAANELLVTALYGARANTVSNMDGTTEVTGNSGATDTTTAPVRGTWTERSDRNNGTSPTVALACYDTIKVSAGSTGDLTATESQSALHGMTVMAFKHPAGTNKTIAAAGGSYAITGATVATKLGRKVAVNGGSYAVTGAAVALRRNLPLVVGGGSYSVTGAAVTLREDRKVSALGGSYSITGAAVTLRHGYAVSVAAGSYSINGTAVSVLHGWKVAAAGGSYSITGGDVALTLASTKSVAVGAGSYAITGNAVSLTQSVTPPVEEVRRGGASYFTQAELRRLAKQERERERKRRKEEEELTETIREAYYDSVNPQLKIERQKALENDDDEEALITMVLHHFRKRNEIRFP